METFILPINLPPEANEVVQPRGQVQTPGNFAQILEENHASGGAQAGDEKINPNGGAGEDRELPTTALIDSALLGSPLPSVLEGKSISIPGSVDPPTAEIPSSPAGLNQEKNLPDLLPLDPTATLRFKESLWPVSWPNPAEVDACPQDFGNPEKWIETGASIPILKGVNAFLSGAEAPVQAPQNSPPLAYPEEMSGQIFSATSWAIEETFIPPGKDQRAIHFSAQDSKSHELMNRLGVMDDLNIGKEGLPIQESRSQNWLVEFFQKVGPEQSVSHGGKFSGGDMGAVPRKESNEIFMNLSHSMVEDHRIPDTQGQTMAPPSDKEFLTNFFATGGKDPEGTLWVRNGDRNLPGKEIQNLYSMSGTSHDGGEGRLAMVGNLKEANPQDMPQPVKLGNQEIYQQVGQKMIWLIRTHEERIKLILDPPQLGHIYMEIRRNHKNITTTLWTDNPVTKLTLETSQGEIQKIIENEGFKLEKFDVFVQQDRGRFYGNGESHMDPDRWPVGSPKEVHSQISIFPDPFAIRVRGFHSGNRYLDLFV